MYTQKGEAAEIFENYWIYLKLNTGIHDKICLNMHKLSVDNP